jgi:hypothetical protein
MDFKALVAVGGHPAALLVSYAYFIQAVGDSTVAPIATVMGGSFLLLFAARQLVVR